MTENKKQGVPDGLPIIGKEEDKAKEMSIAILNALKPTIDNFLHAVEETQRRLAVIEEIVNGALVDVLAKRVTEKLAEPKGLVPYDNLVIIKTEKPKELVKALKGAINEQEKK